MSTILDDFAARASRCLDAAELRRIMIATGVLVPAEVVGTRRDADRYVGVPVLWIDPAQDTAPRKRSARVQHAPPEAWTKQGRPEEDA